jgi:hypothetical protein
MLLMSEKQMHQDEYAGDSSESKQRNNRLKSNHHQLMINKKDSASSSSRPPLSGENDFEGTRPKEYYQTEKFGSHLLMNSDSHTALAASKLQNFNGGEDLPLSSGGNL